MSKAITTTVNEKLARAQSMLDKLRPQLADLLPKHMTPERIIRIMKANLAMNNRLRDCEPLSLLAAVCEAAVIGLEPHTIFGQCFIISYGTKAQLQIGYKGWIELADRSGRVTDLYTEIVYANDDFEQTLGTDRKIRHIPAKDGERGDMVGVYAVAKIVNGGTRFKYLPKTEVMRRKNASAAVRKGNETPWNNPDFEPAMWSKTAILALAPMLPKSPEIARAEALETQADYRGTQQFQLIERAAEAGIVSASEYIVDSTADGLRERIGAAKAMAEPEPEPPPSTNSTWTKITDLAESLRGDRFEITGVLQEVTPFPGRMDVIISQGTERATFVARADKDLFSELSQHKKKTVRAMGVVDFDDAGRVFAFEGYELLLPYP